MDSKLSDVTESMLVGGRVVVDIDVGSRILHEVDRGQGVNRGLLARPEQGKVDAL